MDVRGMGREWVMAQEVIIDCCGGQVCIFEAAGRRWRADGLCDARQQNPQMWQLREEMEKIIVIFNSGFDNNAKKCMYA